MIFGNTGKILLTNEYRDYFMKNPGSRLFMTRGRKVSSGMTFRLNEHVCPGLRPDGWALNDPASALKFIREHERGISILDEGLIETYPTEKVVNHFRKVLFRKFVNPRLKDVKIPHTNVKTVDYLELSDPLERVSPMMTVCVPCDGKDDVKRLVGVMTDKFMKFGYYMTSYETEYSSTAIFAFIAFEAKYTNMLADLSGALLHVSPIRYEQKILRNGLIPYSKSLKFGYPPRVYLFNRCPRHKVLKYGMYKAGSVGDRGFCLYMVKKDKLLSDPIFKDGKQRFYLDPAFSASEITDQTAVFTYGNIPLRIIEKTYLRITVSENGEPEFERRSL